MNWILAVNAVLVAVFCLFVLIPRAQRLGRWTYRELKRRIEGRA